MADTGMVKLGGMLFRFHCPCSRKIEKGILTDRNLVQNMKWEIAL